MMRSSDRLDNRHFLVVDDEPFIRTLVGRFLKRAGAAEVVEAADGREAMALIGSHDMVFDAVVTDVRMQPVDGIELLRAIRTGVDGLKRNTPVLMLTAHAEADLVSEALALDADAFVLKPVDRDALIERVLRALQRTVPIQPAAAYALVGPDGAPRPVSSLELAPAPPTKSLTISIGARPDEPDAPPHPTPSVHMVPLDCVKTNSILARDIHLAQSQRLLIAAPVILTRALLDRLMDLRKVHDSFPHLFVFEPVS